MGKSAPHSSGIPRTTLQRASGVGQGGKVGVGKEGDALEHPSQARNLLGILLIDEPHLPAPKENGFGPLAEVEWIERTDGEAEGKLAREHTRK